MMRGKRFTAPAVAAIAILLCAVIFAACNRGTQTGAEYVTDSNGITVTDAAGRPIPMSTAEQTETVTVIVTEVLTNKNGEHVTDASGADVTVAVTQAVTEAVTDDSGKTVTDANGEVKTEVVTEVITVPVTLAGGEVVTNISGETVTEKVTVPVTEYVTEVATVPATSAVTDRVVYPSSTKGQKTTSPADNPVYDKTTTKFHSTAANVSQTQMGKATPVWIRTLNASAQTRVVDVCSTGDGGYAALAVTSAKNGSFASMNFGKNFKGQFVVLIKYDAYGVQQWATPYGGNNDMLLTAVTRLTDGSFILAGQSPATDLDCEFKGGYDALLVKIGADGTYLWTKSFGGETAEYFSSVAATADGGFVAGGKFFATGDFEYLNFERTRALLIKFDSEGQKQWLSSFGGFMHDNFVKIAVDPSGNIYAVCQSASTDGDLAGAPSEMNGAVVKYSPDGSLLWKTLVGGSGYDDPLSICCDSSGCVLVGKFNVKNSMSDGTFAGHHNAGDFDAYVVRINSSGAVQWTKTFGGINNDVMVGVSALPNGNFCAVGYTASSNRDFRLLNAMGAEDVFILKLSSSGETLSMDSLAGSKGDLVHASCSLGSNRVAIAGRTLSADGSFAGISPASNGTYAVAFASKFVVE